MQSLVTRRLGCLIVLSFLFSLAVGCGGPSPNVRPEEGQVNILKVASLAQHFRSKQKRFPENADELKKWAQTLKPEELQRMGIDNLEEVLMSPRDKQPYQINKPGNDPQAKMGMVSVLVYEKEGRKGKHMTASSRGSFNELTRDELKVAVPDFRQ
jgi:hypothetical protein